MGIFRALSSSVSQVLQEQWREYFSCDALPDNTMLLRAHKRVSARSANNQPNDQIVTNGSVFIVADGQCVLIVSQGKILAVCDSPGAHQFFDPDHPGGIRGFFKDVWSRVGFGGEQVQPITHRVYYLNMRESHGNAFSTPAPVPCRLCDDNTGLDMDASVHVAGVFSYRVADPKTLYRSLIGNIDGAYRRDRLNAQLNSELLRALQASLQEIAQHRMRPYQLVQHLDELAAQTAQRLNERSMDRFGLSIISLAIGSLAITDLSGITLLQHSAVLKDPAMTAASLSGAAAAALTAAASNGASE